MDKLNFQTTYYCEASKTLDKFIQDAFKDFECRIVSIYNTIKKDNKHKWKEDLYNLGFYTVFYRDEATNLPVRRFTIKEENVVFETIIGCQEIKNYFEREISIEHKEIRELKDIPKWKEIFGCGEFPMFHIRCFELGDKQYFSYEITR